MSEITTPSKDENKPKDEKFFRSLLALDEEDPTVKERELRLKKEAEQREKNREEKLKKEREIREKNLLLEEESKSEPVLHPLDPLYEHTFQVCT